MSQSFLLAIARQAGLGEGDRVPVSLDPHGGIVMRPSRRKYELAYLVSRITPKNRIGKQIGDSPR